MAELADAPDLGSGALGRGGSSPLSRTTFFISVLHTYQIYLTGALIVFVATLGPLGDALSLVSVRIPHNEFDHRRWVPLLIYFQPR